ncbi:TolC family protein [Azonexus fungiphilus]|uniref:TolC family protein n=1 Tax=Azonexus fungiphilus TaxID=146940 RepID=UPI00156B9173|nr:TolC family protein [Azonexus fungiphilus]NHC05672.1 TolC family protein [Azonexus fungiphilus]
MRCNARILVLLALVLVEPVRAEPLATLPQAFAAAWARHPLSQSLPLQRSAAAARLDAAAAWTPEPTALAIGGRSDRFNRDRGAEEVELGLAVPLWLPGERSASRALAAADSGLLEGRAGSLRLQLAGELRAAWWDWQLARDEAALAEATAASAARLRDDVARRVAAGDLARADLHQAAGALAAAEADQAEAAVRVEAAAARLQWLTGSAPGVVELRPEMPPAEAADWLAAHPALAELNARAEQARQTQELARTRSRANPELTVATRRERGASGEAAERSWSLALRIPLASGPRHTAAIAEAGADRVEAELAAGREGERLQQAAQLARSQWQAAERRRQASDERARLARETQAFFDKAFRLGESDLPTRLRIAQETLAAERAASRARIQQAAALSAYRQALGLLPE